MLSRQIDKEWGDGMYDDRMHPVVQSEGRRAWDEAEVNRDVRGTFGP